MAEADRERRRDVRVIFRATACLKFDGGQVFENRQTSNFSVSGVFVEGVTGVGVWDKCKVDLRLTGRSSSLVLAMTGQVVRLEEGGVALQFDKVDEDSFCHLQNIVYFNYRQEGQYREPDIEVGVEVEDESLYLGAKGGKSKPLPDNYLGSGREDDDYSGYDDELEQDIIDRIGSQDDEDDF